MRKPKQDFNTLIEMLEKLSSKPLKVGGTLDKQLLYLRQVLSIYHGNKFDTYLETGKVPEFKHVKMTTQRRFRKFKKIIMRHKVKHWNKMSTKKQAFFDNLNLADNITHYHTLTNPMHECLDLPELTRENLKGTYASYNYDTDDYTRSKL